MSYKLPISTLIASSWPCSTFSGSGWAVHLRVEQEPAVAENILGVDDAAGLLVVVIKPGHAGREQVGVELASDASSAGL